MPRSPENAAFTKPSQRTLPRRHRSLWQRPALVENDEITREALNIVLRRDGYEVALAANGAESLASLRRQRPDMILLDMLMPVLDGWHFLEQLKAHDTAAIPIIVVTATILTREWAVDHGCSSCIRKPIDPAKMLEEIRWCLEEYKSGK